MTLQSDQQSEDSEYPDWLCGCGCRCDPSQCRQITDAIEIESNEESDGTPL